MGRVAGIPVGVNWSVLVIFALIAWGLAAEQFPAAYPHQPAWAYAAAGVGAALVFFAGLFAHEVSHAILARRNGIEVESITLWLFGGVARLHGEMPGPGAELRVAGVGPLVSLLLGGVFAAVAAVLDGVAGGGLAVATFSWLAAINLALAVFNVLPAAPLDGGRLLRAALWKWRGERTWAAVVAARAGQGLGAVMIGIGVWEVFFSRAVAGIWLAVLGWFLVGAAAAEQREARIGGALRRIPVRDVMSPEPYTVAPDVTVDRFLTDYLFRHRFSTFPLVEAGRPVGLVTLSRIRQVTASEREAVTLRDVACPMDEVAVAEPDDSLAELLGRMRGCADGRALVLRGGRLVGLVSRSDIARELEWVNLRAGTHSRQQSGAFR